MGWTSDGAVDPDEGLRLLDLVSEEAGDDYWMLLESKGKAIEGDSARPFADGKPRLEVGGFRYQLDVFSPPGSTKGQLRAAAVFVVRDCDAASASIASLLRDQVNDLKVVISVYKAGGDTSKDLQPHLELELTQARLLNHTMLTAAKSARPREIIQVEYQGLEIRSAPQSETGLRGAVRTCTIKK